MTKELLISALQVIKDYCGSIEHCDDCVLDEFCDDKFNGRPETWGLEDVK